MFMAVVLSVVSLNEIDAARYWVARSALPLRKKA
jgi:hypothetical protein